MSKKAKPKVSLYRLKKDEIIWMANNRCEHRHTFLEHPECYKGLPRRRGFLDIEASGLVADFGIMLTYCIKEEGVDEIISGQITKRDIDKAVAGDEDRALVTKLIKDLAGFDEIVTFYGDDYRYDVPFIRTKAVAMDIPFPAFGTIKQVDIYPIIKKKFRLSRNRQENACRVLLGETEKNHVDGAIWRAAARGHKESLAYIMDHNLRDVRDLERLYHKVIGYVKDAPKSI